MIKQAMKCQPFRALKKYLLDQTVITKHPDGHYLPPLPRPTALLPPTPGSLCLGHTESIMACAELQRNHHVPFRKCPFILKVTDQERDDF